jgi:hypothetical protein
MKEKKLKAACVWQKPTQKNAHPTFFGGRLGDIFVMRFWAFLIKGSSKTLKQMHLQKSVGNFPQKSRGRKKFFGRSFFTQFLLIAFLGVSWHGEFREYGTNERVRHRQGRTGPEVGGGEC